MDLQFACGLWSAFSDCCLIAQHGCADSTEKTIRHDPTIVSTRPCQYNSHPILRPQLGTLPPHDVGEKLTKASRASVEWERSDLFLMNF